MVIHVHQGKGSRDRDVLADAEAAGSLREYWRWKKPKVYLFPSTPGHRGLEHRSPIRPFGMPARRRGASRITKRIGPHTLRHSFRHTPAGGGTDLRTIQLLMGHANLQDTTVYLHLSQRHCTPRSTRLEQITIRSFKRHRETAGERQA